MRALGTNFPILKLLFADKMMRVCPVGGEGYMASISR